MINPASFYILALFVFLQWFRERSDHISEARRRGRQRPCCGVWYGSISAMWRGLCQW